MSNPKARNWYDCRPIAFIQGAFDTFVKAQSLVSPIGLTKQPPLTVEENILSAIFTMAIAKTHSLLYKISSVDSWSD
jgi:hypothetical protein